MVVTLIKTVFGFSISDMILLAAEVNKTMNQQLVVIQKLYNKK